MFCVSWSLDLIPLQFCVHVRCHTFAVRFRSSEWTRAKSCTSQVSQRTLLFVARRISAEQRSVLADLRSENDVEQNLFALCLRNFVFGTAFLAFGGCSRGVLLELTFLAGFRFGFFKHCLREGSHIGGREPCLSSFPLKVASKCRINVVFPVLGYLG